MRSVTADPAFVAGRQALRVQLTDDITIKGKPNIDYIDVPIFAVLPITMTNGSLSVDILSRMNSKAPPNARAFAGLAYRIADDFSTFEPAYVRP